MHDTPFIRSAKAVILPVLALVATCIFLSQPVSAQFWRQTGVTLEAGPSFMNMNALNEALGQDEYPELKNAFFALGFSSMRIQNKFIYGASIYNFVSAQASENNRSVLMNHHYLMPRLGGVLYKRPEGQVFMTIGAGGGFSLLRLKPTNSQFFTRQWSSGILFEGMVGAQISRPVEASTGTEFIFLSGVSAGYIYPLSGGFGFEFDNQEGPVTATPAGFYLRVTLGMAGRR